MNWPLLNSPWVLLCGDATKKSCSREKQDHFALVFVGTKTSGILVFCLVAFRCGRETSSDRFFFHTISVFSDHALLNATYTTKINMSLWLPVSWLCLFYLDAVPSTPSGTWSLDQEFISWDKILEQMVPPPHQNSHEPWNLKGKWKLSNKKSFLVSHAKLGGGNSNIILLITQNLVRLMNPFWRSHVFQRGGEKPPTSKFPGCFFTQFYGNPIFKSHLFATAQVHPWIYERSAGEQRGTTL